MGRIGLSEIILIAFAIMILFGSKRLPEIGSALGKAIKEFKKASKDVEDSITDAGQDQNKKT